MTLTHCRGVLVETRREAELLEANGVNVHAVRRYLERLEAAVVADEAGGRYLTTSAHAKRRGVSAETVRQWCEAGKIPGAIRSGSRWKIPA